MGSMAWAAVLLASGTVDGNSRSANFRVASAHRSKSKAMMSITTVREYDLIPHEVLQMSIV